MRKNSRTTRNCKLILLLLLITSVTTVMGEGVKPTILLVKKYPTYVNGKPTTLFKIEQPDGTWGYRGVKGEYFDVIVKNTTDVPTSIHWHGLILPNNQDGVPYVTQLPIPPGGKYHYRFKLVQSGTYWMHSHFGLQAQQLMSAPLIIDDAKNASKEQEVTLFIGDFSYKKPSAILAALIKPKSKDHALRHQPKKPDLNDVKYDAFLTNYHTLSNPEIVRVTPGQTVRLRVIDGAAMSNFFIKTGELDGQAIAIDGHDIHPFTDHVFQLADSQRIDILVKIPNKEGAYPIIAQGEGTAMQTGLILATPKAKIQQLSERADTVAGALDYTQEFKIKSLAPLEVKTPDQTLMLSMQGDMIDYIWMLNHEVWPKIKPLEVKDHKRIEVILKNDTPMAHPIHLHGHVFEVTEIDGKKLTDGAMRDTVLVLPHSIVKIQFDSDNPGNWIMHCHMLYHMARGMITLVNYEGTNLPQWMHFK